MGELENKNNEINVYLTKWGLSDARIPVVNISKTDYKDIVAVSASSSLGCVDNSFFQPFQCIKGWDLVRSVVPLLVMGKVNADEAFKKDTTFPSGIDIVYDYLIENKGNTADGKHADYVKKLGAISLCSDRNLRKAMERENVEVHGVIWILIECFMKKTLSYKEAENIYEWLKKKGYYLPPGKLSYFINKQ